MPEEIQDVNQAEETSAPAEETQEVVEQVADDSQQEAQLVTPTQPATDSNQDLYDENGVPWKNRAMEYKRKTEDLVEKLPTMLEEAINKKTEEPKYTRQQYEAFLKRSEVDGDTANADYAREELRKLDREENKQTFREELNRFKTEQENNVKRQQANNYTVGQYPDAFLRGANGQFVADKNGNPVPNFNHPMGQAMASYLQDEGLQARPDKFFIASKLAYADYASSTQGKTMKKQQQLKEEVGSLQRKTMIEGSGKSAPQSTPAHVKAMERLKQTGSTKDAQVALEALLKARTKE